MDIEALRQELERARRDAEAFKRDAEESKRREEDARRREEDARRDAEDSKRREEDAKRREEDARHDAKNSKETTLEEYLRAHHDRVYTKLKIIPQRGSTKTGQNTNVNGKYYPMLLRHWDSFPTLQKDHYNIIKEACGDRRLFHSLSAINSYRDISCSSPVEDEQGVTSFELVATKAPIRQIFSQLEQINHICQEFNFTHLGFKTKTGELDLASLDNQAGATNLENQRQSGGHRRVASQTEQSKTQRKTYPNEIGYRTHFGGGKSFAFVYEYKAAHKFTVEDVKLALEKELFAKVVKRINSKTTPTDSERKIRYQGDKRVAMALVQCFDYMVLRGLAYGYVASGEALVFLHVKQHDLKTLYYHLCIPEETTDVNGTGFIDVSHTAAAQLASFCLLTLRTPACPATAQASIESAALKTWSVPYADIVDPCPSDSPSDPDSPPEKIESRSTRQERAEHRDAERAKGTGVPVQTQPNLTCRNTEVMGRHKEDEDDGPSGSATRQSRRERANRKRKSREESNKSTSKNNKTSSGSNPRSTDRQYCTQACLLGLKRGWALDKACPNISSHCTKGSNAARHPIGAGELLSLVQKSLQQDPYQDCKAVDPCGFEGKIGAIGALFKITVPQYGYTLVGKGTQSAHLPALQHECIIYSQLETLQGEIVPVHFGIANLANKGYFLSGGAEVFHMMLMSWCGEVAAEMRKSGLQDQVNHAFLMLHKKGVDHNDIRDPNILWSRELDRVMIVDFDQARLVMRSKKISSQYIQREYQ